MIQTIQQAVVPHDQYQIELKLDYELLKGKKTHYQVETYIFVPRTLGISKETYPKRYFYNDLLNYIRFKTPTLILRDFDVSPISPIQSIRATISQPGWVTDQNQIQTLVGQLKLLAAMLKSAIREHIDHLRNQLKSAPDGTSALLIKNLVEEFLSSTAQISETYRGFYNDFSLPNVNEQILTGYTFADESISVLIEEGLVELLELVDGHLNSDELVELHERLCCRVREETHYRWSKGYESILEMDSDNEAYVYRTNILKKYASSILYLSTDMQREGQRLEHMTQAIAAGIAMIFATAIAFYFQSLYGNLTVPFFAALVVGYMFKDRIKEIGRSFFANQLHNIMHDRRIAIYTQDEKHCIGVLREKMSILPEDDLPRRIREARNCDRFVQMENDGAGETVIRYTKDIVLYADAIRNLVGETSKVTAINDIIRYDIRSLLSKMDNPMQERLMLQQDKLVSVATHKVYHVNLITKYASHTPEKDKTYRRHRLILNRSGIKRIEPVSL
ncbi:MAG: hypothetical protein AAF702_05750 [Chloroflexota bacterium]